MENLNERNVIKKKMQSVYFDNYNMASLPSYLDV